MSRECLEAGKKHYELLQQVKCAICTKSSTDSLFETSLKYIVDHLDVICDTNPVNFDMTLKAGIVLPREISERLFDLILQRESVLSRNFVNIFRDTQATQLKRLIIPATNVNNKTFEILLKHEPVELDVSNCPELTDQLLPTLSHHCARSLESLSIGRCDYNYNNYHLVRKSIFDLRDNGFGTAMRNRSGLKRLVNLKRLTINNTSYTQFDSLIRPLTNLVSLDLSNALREPNRLEFLKELTNLKSLVLHDFKYVDYAMGNICCSKKLRHLDISISDRNREVDGNCYQNPSKTLAYIVDNLPCLQSLDISCTNLAGTGVAQYEYFNGVCSDIGGLFSRAERPLQFLGLYKTDHSACKRHHIPAKSISGDGSEEQILVAAFCYMNRVDYLQQVLNDLYAMLRYSVFKNLGQALTLILTAMEVHIDKKSVQIATSATLFYILKNREKTNNALSCAVKKRIITNLVNGMMCYREDETIMRNGCLNLCQFRIPNDMIFEYERLVIILIDTIIAMERDSFIQRIGIYLLNSLACQVDTSQKARLGELGVIQKMLQVIEKKVANQICDDVLEVAWSAMWNVTDETSVNSEIFLDNDGLNHFINCLQVYPQKDELVRNMMGLLGNVAEVKSLRKSLMNHQLIGIFADLLSSPNDGIEVSYNAAGVLAHIASDGEHVWTISEPNRDAILQKMTSAILSWNVKTERNINYRSFKPILELTEIRHTMECQLWATWALANLTSVYPEKYCSLVVEENGLEYLQNMLKSNITLPTSLVNLADIVIENCTINTSNQI